MHAAQLRSRSGLEWLQAMIAGEVPPPPVMQMLDMGEMEASEGLVIVTMRAQEFHYNPLGGVHGGVRPLAAQHDRDGAGTGREPF